MQLNYFHGYTDSEPKVTTLEEVVRVITDDASVRDLTAKHRHYLSVGDEKSARQCKRLLPCFAVAVRFSGGKQQCHIVDYTGLSIVDIDHVAPDDLARVLAVIKRDPHTLLAYTTVSGHGVRVLARYLVKSCEAAVNRDYVAGEGLKVKGCEATLTSGTATINQAKPINHAEGILTAQSALTSSEATINRTEGALTSDKVAINLYKESFLTINDYYQQLTGMKPDHQCKNLTRLSGIAHDPAAHYNAQAVPFTIEQAARRPVGRPRKGVKVERVEGFVRDELQRRGVEYTAGSHNNYIAQACYLMNRYGVSEDDCTDWVLANFTDYHAEDNNVQGIVHSCYLRTDEHAAARPPRETQERYATVKEIEDYLTEKNIRIRHNLVSRKWEIQSCAAAVNSDDVAGEGLRAASSGESQQEASESDNVAVKSLTSRSAINQAKPNNRADSTLTRREATINRTEGATWNDLTDRHVNSIYRAFSLDTGRRLRISDLYIIIESDFYPTYHPFREYLEALPPWDGTDHIESLASRVHVVGCEQAMHNRYFKKWFVAMVATWIEDGVTNHEILTYIGPQGIYKSTFMRMLLPPALRSYFSARNFAQRMSKDDRLELTETGLIALEELDRMKDYELNQIKAITTDPSVNERAAYAHFRERREHIASFCGTGNNPRFLTDLTGNRRWLPFMVESIDSPYTHPMDYEGLYAQAFALWRSHFPYWLDEQENAELEAHNRHFEEPNIEEELILTYLRKPCGDEVGEFVTATRIMELIGAYIKTQLSPRHITMTMKRLGFEQRRTHTSRGWNVIFLTGDEIKNKQRQEAHNSVKDSCAGEG